MTRRPPWKSTNPMRAACPTHRRCLLLCLFVLAWSFVSGQTLPAQSALYTIAGTVVNAQTGDPIPRADVAVLSSGDSHTLSAVVSDDQGRFALPGLPAAKYQLTASRRGFLTAFYLQHGDFSSAIVTGPAQDTQHLVFRLMPGAVLRGVISSDSGDPVENARVLLFLKPRSPAQRIAPAGTATTSDTGAYEFGDLAPGQYFLAVKADPWYAIHPAPGQPGNPQLDVAYPVTYYDSTTDEASATPIDLAAGSRQQADVSLHAVPALHLQVQVPRNQEGSLARAELRQSIFGVEIAAQSSGFVDSMKTGTTEFTGVAPGRYELQQGDPPRVTELDANDSGPVDPTAGVPLVSVSGILRSATGAPLPANLSVLLTRVGAAPADAGYDRQPGDRFTVPAQPLSLAVTVSSAAASVQGFARLSGKPFAGAMIVLVPRSPASQTTQSYASLIRRDQSDSDGSFSLLNVVPGSYTVVAIQDGWALDWTSPAVLHRFLATGVPVTVPPDSAATISLSAPVPVESP